MLFSSSLHPALNPLLCQLAAAFAGKWKFPKVELRELEDVAPGLARAHLSVGAGRDVSDGRDPEIRWFGVTIWFFANYAHTGRLSLIYRVVVWDGSEHGDSLLCDLEGEALRRKLRLLRFVGRGYEIEVGEEHAAGEYFLYLHNSGTPRSPERGWFKVALARENLGGEDKPIGSVKFPGYRKMRAAYVDILAMAAKADTTGTASFGNILAD